MNSNYRAIDYRNNPNNFKTTYGISYRDVPTFYASPLYETLHKRQREPEPYDDRNDVMRRDAELRELERQKMAEFYRRDLELEEARRENERERQESPYRNRPRDESPQRHSYNEPLSHRSRYEDDFGQRNDFRKAPMAYRNGDERASPRRERIPEEFIRPDFQPENLGDEYDSDRPPRFCNRCFKTNVCINKFKCCHQYCDDCMKRLKGAENPFRGAWLWHFKCGICKNYEWCSEQRLVRYDAKGRRIVRYKGMKYLNS